MSSRPCSSRNGVCGQRALAIGFEGTEVVLEPCDQRDVPERAGGTQRIQEVADHCGVDADVLGFRRLPRPGRDEHGLLITMTPGGAEGFFIEVEEQGLHPSRDMPRIVEIAARYGLEFVGPPA